MLLRESLGISADGSEKAFFTQDIASMVVRVPQRLTYNSRDPVTNVNHVFVAVDPSGGGASAFSIASLVQDANGFTHVRTISHILLPHACQCAHHDNKAVWPLRHPVYKGWNRHG